MALKRIPRTKANPTLRQARELPDWADWYAAVRKELQMLADMGCFEVVRQVPINPKTGRRYQVIPCKMDLRLKFDAMGIPTKHKGRLVVLGDREWSDCLRDVFAPTINCKTINLLLAIAAQQGLHLYGLDIFGAFITADIDKDEPVYVQLPKGLDPDNPESQPIWRLLRTLYGLNRAPKAFFDQLTQFLRDKGYSQSAHDPCLFFKINSDGRRIYFCIHVDDFAIAASHTELITELCDFLKEKYTITETDNLESFLGIHIVQDHERLYLSQPGHIAKCAREAGITPATKPSYIPMSPSFNDAEQEQSPPGDKGRYATLLGMLIFLLRTRPDVAYAVNRLATRASNCTQKDYDCLCQVANYLYTTAHLELVYNTRDPAQRSAVVKLFAYSDAAFLTHADSKSHSGIHFTLGEGTGVFHARSQKQKMVTLSSTEAEVYAAIECAKDAIFFRDVLSELGYKQLEPTTLFIDNKSAIALSKPLTGDHRKVRHFKARLNFLIEQVEQQVLKLEHLEGTVHPSDILSKPKPRPGHEKNTSDLMGPQQPGADTRLAMVRMLQTDSFTSPI